MPTNTKNEKMKRKYFGHLKGIGLSKATIESSQKSICLYEDYTDFGDFAKFSQKRAMGFKEWLAARKFKGRPISVATQYHHLRHLKGFFTWLSGQLGYRSRISLDNVSYLCLEKKKVREAIAPKCVDFPSLEYVRKLADSVVIKTEIDRRDRGLIAFLLLSGMRVKAICTLPLGCFDPDTFEIRQDPGLGVDTKFGKPNTSYLFRFDDTLLGYFLEWVNYLKEVKLFGSADPLFPRSEVRQAEDGLAFTTHGVEPAFWKGTNGVRDILKECAKVAGLKYYNPHSYRHAAAYLAVKSCRTGEEFKAISQNFSHEYLKTTIMTYGNLDSHQVGEIIREMDFNPSKDKFDKPMMEEIGKVIQKYMK